MNTETLLVEIGTEELPPKALGHLAQAFTEQLLESLSKAKLVHGKVQSYYAPRRLAIKIEALMTEQVAETVERRGPSWQAAFDEQGQPTKALQGFLRGAQATLEEVAAIDTEKGKWVVVRQTMAGQKTAALLPGMIENALKKLPIPKMMRWGNGDTPFVRPVQWLVVMLGPEVVPGALFGKVFDRKTFGHRFHHPETLTLNQAADYPAKLQNEGFVVADAKTRQELIGHQITEITEQLGAQAIVDADLLAEVANIVEWPVAILCEFDRAFLDVPKEALISAMQGHQKSFPVVDQGGQLEPYFIAVSNIASKRPESVKTGNEKVMRARLSDAAFFYHTDLKTPLAEHLPALSKMTFQAQLGSLGDKTARIMQLSCYLAQATDHAVHQAERAAELAKCDLLTNMVMEFPEVQGVMGEYYALAHGEDKEVAQALREQYHPRFAGDNLPATQTGKILALADKVDTLVGIFGINQKPTGSKDPFALRRAAIGVIRLLTECGFTVDLKALVMEAAKQYTRGQLSNQQVVTDVIDFIFERLRYYYQDQGQAFETIDAVMTKNLTDLSDIQARILTLAEFRHSHAAESLASANKRVKNILQKNAHIPAEIQKSLLLEAAEKTLYHQLLIVKPQLEKAIVAKQYGEALTALAALKTPVDAFFDQVMVMVEDSAIRQNRLNLLSLLQGQLSSVADISRL